MHRCKALEAQLNDELSDSPIDAAELKEIKEVTISSDLSALAGGDAALFRVVRKLFSRQRGNRLAFASRS